MFSWHTIDRLPPDQKGTILRAWQSRLLAHVEYLQQRYDADPSVTQGVVIADRQRLAAEIGASASAADDEAPDLRSRLALLQVVMACQGLLVE